LSRVGLGPIKLVDLGPSQAELGWDHVQSFCARPMSHRVQSSPSHVESKLGWAQSDRDKIGLGWAKSSWAYIGQRNQVWAMSN